MSSGPNAARWRVVELGDVDSTQEEAKRRLRAGEALDGLVLRAARQLAGRGRRGRTFVSEAGGSYQSFVLDDPEGRWRGGGTLLALTVGVAEALAARGVRVGAKWPNDLLDAGSGKCGGLLAEHVRGHLVVGVGLNAGEGPDGFGRLALDLPATHEAALDGIDRGLRLAAAPDRLPAAYARWDALSGRGLTVLAGDGAREVRGTARGVDADGALRLDTPDGLVSVSSGSVTRIDTPSRPHSS